MFILSRFAFAKYENVEQANKAVAAQPTLKSGRAIKVAPEDPNAKINRPPRFAMEKSSRNPSSISHAFRSTTTGAPRVRKPRVVDPASLDSKRVFIGYLPEGVTEASVKSAFTGVAIVELRGKYGYVTFDSDANATAAVAKNETKAFGGEQNVKVEVANRPPRAPRAPKAESSA